MASLGLRSCLLAVVTVAVLVGACTTPEPTPVAPPLPPALFVWPTFPDPPATPLPRTVADPLQAVLDHAVEINSHLPESEAGAAGITAAVVTDRGTWTGAAGVDGRGAPSRPSSTGALGGISHTVAAAEVLHLADTGRIRLDVPLSTYVAHRLAGAATVRQFLGMQSGLGDGDPDAYTGPRAPPGTAATYSDLGYLLLGRGIEQVTGRTAAAATHADLPGAPGAAVDASSLARWGYDLYGARILPPGTVAAMTAPAGPGQVVGGYRYGLGTMLFSQTLGLGDAFGHIGYAPGAESILAAVPGRHIAVAVLIADDDKTVTGPVQEIFAVLEGLTVR